MKTVICLKHGAKYSAEYVNVLYSMVERNISPPFKFICFTEDPNNLRSEVEVRNLPNGLHGWWYKPWLFSKDTLLEGTILYIDLDVVISGSLDKLFDYSPGDWCTIRDFTRSMRPDWKKYNSSVIRFEAGQLEYIWQNFKADKDNLMKRYFGDQDYLFAVSQENNPAVLFPDDWIQSWKWEVRKSKDLTPGPRGQRTLAKIENVKPGAECSICVFHGDPNPHNCLDPWVVDNWK